MSSVACTGAGATHLLTPRLGSAKEHGRGMVAACGATQLLVPRSDGGGRRGAATPLVEVPDGLTARSSERAVPFLRATAPGNGVRSPRKSHAAFVAVCYAAGFGISVLGGYRSASRARVPLMPI